MSDETTAKDFRDRLRELREESGLTQDELARAIGVSRPTVTQWETGYSFPKLRRVYDLAGVLGCDVSDLFDSVAKPAEPRPSGGGAQGTDEAEVPVEGWRLAEWAVSLKKTAWEVDNAVAFLAATLISTAPDDEAYSTVQDTYMGAWASAERLGEVAKAICGLLPEEDQREIEWCFS